MVDYKEVNKDEIAFPKSDHPPEMRGDEIHTFIDNFLRAYHVKVPSDARLHVEHVGGGIGGLVLRLIVEPGPVKVSENNNAPRRVAEAIKFRGFCLDPYGYNSLGFEHSRLGNLSVQYKP